MVFFSPAHAVERDGCATVSIDLHKEQSGRRSATRESCALNARSLCLTPAIEFRRASACFFLSLLLSRAPVAPAPRRLQRDFVCILCWIKTNRTIHLCRVVQSPLNGDIQALTRLSGCVYRCRLTLIDDYSNPTSVVYSKPIPMVHGSPG